ncbi:MAG: hypothetical protein COS84_08440 [Armatimonadetes bacterium CG07_land_8_20_14_0_80_40_9]|nr:MAG: hypothetical protein COS84_08440 [Armatimonadetes bacterium CG07_land_8_20_14_0_80_40_9]
MKKKHKSQTNNVKESMAVYYKTKGEIKLPPKEYWEDNDWIHQNSTELSKNYPNMWIAVVNKKVVAYGEDASRVMEEGEKSAGEERSPVIIFIERGIHVY